MTESAAEGASLEAPNIVTLLYRAFPDSPVTTFLHHFEVPFFSGLVIAIVSVVAYRVSRNAQRVPTRGQNALEAIVEYLDRLVTGIMGPQGRAYTPFIGTLFIYILSMNLIGLVPGMHSPTSSINTTVTLALLVFIYVQYTGVRKLGPVGYIGHLAGNPRPKGVMGYATACVSVPFNLVIHVMGELTKPISLSVRLFGNIFGEDVLIAQMVLLGIAALAFFNSPVGLPLQLPFYLLALLTSVIQALVFSLLSVIYIFLMLPHHPHQEESHTSEGG